MMLHVTYVMHKVANVLGKKTRRDQKVALEGDDDDDMMMTMIA